MSEQTPSSDGALKESFVLFQASQGMELRASLRRMTRFLVVFEIHSPTPIVRISEVLARFQIVANERTLYSGKATISNIVNVGVALVCEAKLDETGWNLAPMEINGASLGSWTERFTNFLSEGQQRYRMHPEFKRVIADFKGFLEDLRLWLEQVELGISLPRPPNAPGGNFR